jgi:hypothetical protein
MCDGFPWRAAAFQPMPEISYELYVEPNPHEPGTYAWAREEHARGRDVKNERAYVYHTGMLWNDCAFFPSEFETKTWRHA